MNCFNCGKKLSDGNNFCVFCGSSVLAAPNNQLKRFLSKRYLVVAAGLVILLGTVFFIVSENNRLQKIKDDIDSYYYQKEISKYLSTPTTSDLKIQDGWTTEKSGNYIYIRGSVKNISSSKTVSYFKITAKFYDRSGDVIDSDYTNSGEDLYPGESAKFEIMHRYDSRSSDIRLTVEEVS